MQRNGRSRSVEPVQGAAADGGLPVRVADGLAVWHAIEQCVTEYLAIYYPNDGALQADVELQAWWKEAREVATPTSSLKDEPWWPKMRTTAELAKACATIVWIAENISSFTN
jgi:linoleate 9S-lipoxygenase